MVAAQQVVGGGVTDVALNSIREEVGALKSKIDDHGATVTAIGQKTNETMDKVANALIELARIEERMMMDLQERRRLWGKLATLEQQAERHELTLAKMPTPEELRKLPSQARVEALEKTVGDMRDPVAASKAVNRWVMGAMIAIVCAAGALVWQRATTPPPTNDPVLNQTLQSINRSLERLGERTGP